MIPVIGQKTAPAPSITIGVAGNQVKFELTICMLVNPDEAAGLAHALLKAAALVTPPMPAVTIEPTYVNR